MLDCHTHNPASIGPEAIFNAPPEQLPSLAATHPHGLFSTGIHPWHTIPFDTDPTLETEALRQLEAATAMPQVAAIGETGIDLLRGATLPTQERIFRAHVTLAERLQKPLLLHVVKSYNEILQIRREIASRLTQPWIFHGFRGKPQLARQLLASSTPASPVLISLGEKFNPLTAREIPLGSLLTETDCSPLTIRQVNARVDAARGGQAISERTQSPLPLSASASARQ